MKPTSEDIKCFYTLSFRLRTKLKERGEVYTKRQMDDILKFYATIQSEYFAEPTDFTGSCKGLTHDELQTLKELTKQFAALYGIDLDE